MAENRILNFCTNVFSSCCSIEDQKVIYNQWILSEEEKILEQKLNWFYSIYSKLLKQLKEVQKRAEVLQKALEKKPISNCQILSRRLTQMQMDYIQPRLDDQLRLMNEFFKSSFKGLYCSVCDSQVHKFINKEANTITIADGFCRETILNVLKPMLYLHDLLHKYANLVTKFLMSCNHDGKFKDKVPSPKYLFHTEYKNRGMLSQCHENVNKVDWLESCENVCNQIKLTSFNLPFLSPHLQQYMEYNNFLEDKLEVWDELVRAAYMQKTQKQEDTGITSPSRILEEKKDLGHRDPRRILQLNQWRMYGDSLVFKSTMNALIKLDSMKKVYGENGLDLYTNGKKSVITLSNFKEITNAISKRRLKEIKRIEKERELLA